MNMCLRPGGAIYAAVLIRSALLMQLLLAFPAVAQQRVQVIESDKIGFSGEVVRITDLDAPYLRGRRGARPHRARPDDDAEQGEARVASL
jgi:hypothetical protein